MVLIRLMLRGCLVLLWRSLVLLRRRLTLLWRCLTLLLRGCLTLLLRRRLALLLRSRLALLLLRSDLALLLWCRLTLLLLRICLALRLLLRSHLALLLLLGSHLALLRIHLALLLLLRSHLALLRIHLALLLLRICLALLLLHGSCLMLLLLWRHLNLALLQLRTRLALLCCSLIVLLDRRGSSYAAIGRNWLVHDRAGRAAMIDVRKLCPVGAGNALILDLIPHGRGMLIVPCRQFRWTGSHLDSTRAAIEAHACATAEVVAALANIDVMNPAAAHVVVRAVVIEVAAAPIASLVSDANVAEAVVDAAVVADVGAPVATVKPVAVMVETPVAGRPKSALVGSLNPYAGHPVVSALTPGPVTRRPHVVVPGRLGLVVFGQRRRRLGSVGYRLLSVTRIIGTLVLPLVIVLSIVGGWSALLVSGGLLFLATVGGRISCLRLAVWVV